MHIWYYSVCDEHKEAQTFFVNTPSRTQRFLCERDEQIFSFLSRHYGCDLKMIHSDEDLDKLWDGGYIVMNVGSDPSVKWDLKIAP